MTMPVVPRMDRPPTMPSRPFSVRSRDRLAAGNRDFHHDVGRWRRPHGRDLAIASRIMARGAGLIAGSPGAQRQAGPRHRADALAGRGSAARARRRDAQSRTTSAPWVTSGSSPASLTMPARAEPSPFLSGASAKLGRLAAGQPDRDGIGEMRRSAAPRSGAAPPPRRRRRWSSRAAIASFRLSESSCMP